MSRPEPRYADSDARNRSVRLHSAWDAWRLDSDADLALSEAEDACRCDDVLQAGEIVDRQYLLLEPVAETWAFTCWSAWDLIDDQPATAVVLNPLVSPVEVDFHNWVASGSNRHPPLIRQGGQWRDFHWHILEGAPGGSLSSVHRRDLRPLTVLGQVLEAVSTLLEEGFHHGHLVPDVFLLPPGRPVWLLGHSLAMKSADMPPVIGEIADATASSPVGSDATELAKTLLSLVAEGDGSFEDPDEVWSLGLRFLPALPEFQKWRDALNPRESVSVEELLSDVLSSPCVQHSLAREAAAHGEWSRVNAHLDVLLPVLDQPPVDALLLRARALERLEEGDPVSAWRAVLDAHQTREQAYEALRALAVLAPDQMSLGEGMWLTAVGEGLLDNSALQEHLAELMLQEGNGTAAATMLVQAAKRGLDSVDRLARVLTLLESVEDWNGWIEVATAVLERRPDSALEEQVADVHRLLFRSPFTPEDASFKGQGAASLRWRCAAASPSVQDLQALRALGGLSPSQWMLLLEPSAGLDEDRSELLAAALAEYPQHPGLLLWKARGMDAEGDQAGAMKVWQAISDRTEGMGHNWWVEAQHALAEGAWRAGGAREAAERWHAILNLNERDRRAWWGLARVTWLSSSVPPVSILPRVAVAEEALARLLSGLISGPAMAAWLADQTDAQPGEDEHPLLLAAQVVEELRGQIGTELFDVLGQHFPETALAVEATRLLFGQEQERAPVEPEDTYRWTQDEPSTVLGVERSWVFAEIEDLDAIRLTSDLNSLLTLQSGESVIEAALEEPAMLWTEDEDAQVQLRDERGRIWVLSGPDHSLGGGDLDDHVIPALSADRLRAHSEGGHWYLSATETFLADHRPVEEVRLGDGLRLDVDGIRLMVRFVEDDERLTGEIEPVAPEGPTTQQEPDAVLRIADREGRPLGSFELSGSIVYLGSNPVLGPVRSEEDWQHCIRRTGGFYSVSERMRPTVFSTQSASIPDRHFQPQKPMPVGDFLWSIHEIGEPDSLPVNVVDPGAVALLRLVSANGNTVDVWVESELYSIGRGEDMQLRLKGDPKASRHHCTIIRESSGEWTLRDFGSANGTFVNGVRTDAHTLAVGDTIGVGSVTLVFMGAEDGDDDVELLELD